MPTDEFKNVPDHSAFSRARNERFGDSNIFRWVFERIVGTCIAAGLAALRLWLWPLAQAMPLVSEVASVGAGHAAYGGAMAAPRLAKGLQIRFRLS